MAPLNSKLVKVASLNCQLIYRSNPGVQKRKKERKKETVLTVGPSGSAAHQSKSSACAKTSLSIGLVYVDALVLTRA